MKSNILKTEDARNGNKALNSFKKSAHYRRGHNYSWTFEHGQLWIASALGGIWSVVDASGPGTISGFDFEQVSNDEDEE